MVGNNHPYQVGVELQRARADGLQAEPLAQFILANLWVLYASTPDGRSHVSLSLPTVQGIDLRAGVPPEQVRYHNVVHHKMTPELLCIQHDTCVMCIPSIPYTCHTINAWTEQALAISSGHDASFLMLEYGSDSTVNASALQVHLQRPRLVGELGFVLGVAQFAVPDIGVGGAKPIPFVSLDVVLDGVCVGVCVLYQLFAFRAPHAFVCFLCCKY